jgi:S-DNA-T family DNA segregation ATPase FtsK/SpoIIIE
VIGPTGSGKSELIHLALASLDEKIQVFVADYKGGAVLTECSGIAGVSDLDADELQKDFWLGIQQELARREQELKHRGVASIEAAVRVGVGLPRLLVVVDEVVAAIRMCPASLNALTAVATRGRSLGIHLLLTSQSLVGIPRELLINLRNRLALAGTDEVELLQLGFKQKFSGASRNTKAALFSQDGQVESVEVPLGIRRAPRLEG